MRGGGRERGGGRGADAPRAPTPLPPSPRSYAAIVDLTRSLNARPPPETAAATLGILSSLFPCWLPPAFAAAVARPFPRAAARLNAEVTALTCAWLMGPLAVNDGGGEGSGVARSGVLVERCRYLEETGCASACLNSCKLPTQAFFAGRMGLDLWMAPDFDTFECQFSFGVPPPPPDADPALATGCLAAGCGSGLAGAGGPGLCPGAVAARAGAGGV